MALQDATQSALRALEGLMPKLAEQPQAAAAQPPAAAPQASTVLQATTQVAPLAQQQPALGQPQAEAPLIEPDIGYFQLPDGRQVIEDPDNPGRWTAVTRELDPVISAAAAAAIAAAQRGRMEGVVAEWNGSPGPAPGRGYGFVHFSDGRRAYVHSSQCSGQALQRGQAVAADIVEDPKNPGKWQAVNVERIHALSNNGAGRLEGIVAEWTGNPGYGFIHFADGRRAYVHNSQCGGSALIKGTAVTGLIAEDPKNPGKWQAQSVAALVTPGAGTQIASLPGVPGVPGVPGLAGASGIGGLPGVAASPSAVPQERHQGVVTQWNEKGFGFIQFSDGRFAYVHNSSAGGHHLTPGETVTAVLVEDSKNPGKLAAQDVQRLNYAEDGVVVEWDNNQGYGFMQMDDGRQAYVSRQALGGIEHLLVGLKLRVRTSQDARNPGKWCVAELLGSPGQDGTPDVLAISQELPVMGERCTGTVVEWDGKGVGVVLMEDGRQAEVYDSSPLEPGQIISAMLSQDPQIPGKFVAQGLELGPYMGDEGTVTEWHENQGYGFIQLDDGRKLYIHRSAFGGVGGLAVGSRIRVTTKPDIRNPGKWMAGQVMSSDGTALGNTGPRPARPSRTAAVSQLATSVAAAASTRLPGSGIGGSGIMPVSAGMGDRGGIGGSGINPVGNRSGPTLGGLLSGSALPGTGRSGNANQALSELMAAASAAAAELTGDPLAKRARMSAPAVQFPMI